MKRITTFAAVFMLLVVAMGAMTGTVAAQESPTITADSDLDDGDVIENFAADSDETETLEFETDTTIDTQSLELTVEAQNGTHYEVDDGYAAYELVEEDNADGSDVHAFEIGHDDLETVPIDASDETDVTMTLGHTYVNADGDTVTDETEITVTLQATNERTVLYLNDEAIENDDVGPEVEETELDSGWNPFADDDNETEYEYQIEDDLAIDGNATDVFVYLEDENVANGFETDADSGSFISDMTLVDTDDDDVYRVYASSTGDEIDAAEDTYMLVHGDHLEINVGDDYDGETSLAAHMGNHAPGDLDGIGFMDLQSTYFEVHGLSFWSLDVASFDFFGVLNETRAASGGLLPFLSLTAASGIVVSRRFEA